MGNDGGSLTNKRGILDSVSKGTANARNDDGGHVGAAAAAALRREERWRHCALSRRLLWPPVVADRRGNLLRKDALLELLLARKTDDASHPLLTDVNVAAFAHVRKLKDVKALAFEVPRDIAARVEDGEDGGSERDAARLISCAVTGACGSSATVPFAFFWECGHAVAEAAVAAGAAGGDGVRCPLCDAGRTRVALVQPEGAAAAVTAAAVAPEPRKREREAPTEAATESR